MVGELPYALKYGPLLECLASRNERVWLSNYPPEIAEHFRQLDERAIQDYVKELQKDFEALYKAALPAALDDLSLAEYLNKMKGELLSIKQLARRNVFHEDERANISLRALLRNMQALQSIVLRPIV